MSRRRGTREAGDPIGSPADDGALPKRRRWVFPAVAGGLAAVWLVMNLPHAEDPQGEPMPYTTKRAGWPDFFSRWSVANDTGKTTYSSFSSGALLFDLATLAAPIVVAWVVIRHLGRVPEQAAVRHRGTGGPASSPGEAPSSHPPATARVTGGWG
jgi:hypothetical protein